jgi:AraC-like DNA-binding protein
LHLPRKEADGVFFADSIDKSFSYVVMNAHLKNDCVLQRVSNNQTGLVIFFNQIDVHNYFKIRVRKDSLEDTSTRHRKNIFISTSNTDIEVTYPGGTKIKRVGIYLSPQWVSSNFETDARLQINMLTREEIHQVNKLKINRELEEKLDQIFQVNPHNETERLALKSRMILLLDFFCSTYIKEDIRIRKKELIPDADIQRLKHIEALLASEETEAFPSISMLARIAQMSGTKLKQRFRQVYGSRLYEFYNNNRLEKARQLIEAGNSAKNAGYAIGFTDVSNFSKAFKKKFGFNPGKMRVKRS